MSLSQDEITAQIEQIRQNRLKLAAESCGEITDLLCIYVHNAIEWREKFWEGVGIGLQEWQNPEKSNAISISVLSSEAVLLLFEMSECLRAGLMRPAIQTWRKLKEVQVNALYMESDPAGEVAWRWLHWGVSDAAALDPNNKTLEMEAEFSRRLFEGKDERYGRFGTWAKMPNGKKTPYHYGPPPLRQ